MCAGEQFICQNLDVGVGVFEAVPLAFLVSVRDDCQAATRVVEVYYFKRRWSLGFECECVHAGVLLVRGLISRRVTPGRILWRESVSTC
jgi:hypothetical protein